MELAKNPKKSRQKLKQAADIIGAVLIGTAKGERSIPGIALSCVGGGAINSLYPYDSSRL